MSATVPFTAAAIFATACIGLLIHRLARRRAPKAAPAVNWRSWAVDTHEWAFDPNRSEEN